jgi:sugar lactone lactonase YvrE
MAHRKRTWGTLVMVSALALVQAGCPAPTPQSIDLGEDGIASITTLAGTGEPGSTNGPGTVAQFRYPISVAVDVNANIIYVADTGNHCIRKITSAGVVTTFAGYINNDGAGVSGSDNGQGTAAKFWDPSGVAVDGIGTVYVADTKNHLIRKISPEGVVTTLAGTVGEPGAVDGQSTAAKFDSPSGVAVDKQGNVYVADRCNNRIRKISSTGAVTTIVDTSTPPTNDTVAKLDQPLSVALDGEGNLYVTEFHHRICKITFTYTDDTNTTVASTELSTFAGSASLFGTPGPTYDRTGAAARFQYPRGVAFGGTGNLYVADTDNHRIRKITPAGVVTTFAGSVRGYSDADRVGQFNKPSGVAFDANGNVYVADTDNHCIRKINVVAL